MVMQLVNPFSYYLEGDALLTVGSIISIFLKLSTPRLAEVDGVYAFVLIYYATVSGLGCFGLLYL